MSDTGVRVVKPAFVRDLGAVDIAALKGLLARISDQVWNAENEKKENNFSVFHHTRHIVFRFIPGQRDHREYYSTPVWAAWRDHLQRIMDRAVLPYGFDRPVFPKVMLARLAAGAEIDRHVDGLGANLFTHKIHVPLETNAQAEMIIQDRAFHLQEGRAYELNNLAPHAAVNHGPTDRIHLIFEVFGEAG